MTRYKVIDGETIQFTPAEEAARDAEETAIGNQRPLRDWETAMGQTDNEMPRWYEDYITDNNIQLSAGRTKDNYEAKIALRATRP